MGEEADADWEAGMLEAGYDDTRRWEAAKIRAAADDQCKAHKWSDWKEIGRTGDWFHPLIVERKCKRCGITETDEH